MVLSLCFSYLFQFHQPGIIFTNIFLLLVLFIGDIGLLPFLYFGVQFYILVICHLDILIRCFLMANFFGVFFISPAVLFQRPARLSCFLEWPLLRSSCAFPKRGLSLVSETSKLAPTWRNIPYSCWPVMAW